MSPTSQVTQLYWLTRMVIFMVSSTVVPISRPLAGEHIWSSLISKKFRAGELAHFFNISQYIVRYRALDRDARVRDRVIECEP